jgi:S-DNA-T family DNA segregation ATPase FtsK/SpoIIIE
LSQTSSPSAGSRLTQAVKKGVREGAAILVAAGAVWLLLALTSFSASDPGFSYSGDGQPVRNWMGLLGANMADVLLFLFGRPSFLLPVMLLAAGWLIFRNRMAELAPATRVNAAVRVGGFLLLLAASSALASMHWSPGDLRQGAGGVLGKFVGQEGLARTMNRLGATLLLLAVWMAGAAIAFHVSWLAVFDRLGHGFWFAVDWCRSWLASRREVADGQERKRARHEVVKQETKKKITPRVAPVIEAPAPVVEKSERAEQERQVTLFDPPKAGELPPMQLLDDPPERIAAYSAEALEAMSSRSRDHPLRDAARARHEGQPDLRAVQGSGARLVRGVRARGRGHSRQARRGS